MPEILPVGLPPAEAVEYFRRKGYEISFDWQDMYAEDHARAFTVAKVTRMDVLRDIREEVDRAIAEGITSAEFQKRLRPRLEAKGWWGRKRVTDPRTGEEREVQLGSPRRLEVIYDTNLRTSYAAGRWERIQRVKDRRPYLRYVAILDERTRPRHRQWHGTVLPVDHPFWAKHYPPNGWRCRCAVQQLSDRDLTRYGYEVSPSAPSVTTRTWQNPRTGEVRQIPIGIDPGFDYRPGPVAVQSQSRRVLTEKLEAAAAEAPDLARATLRQLVDSEDFGRFLEIPSGDYPVMLVPDVAREVIGAQPRVAVLSSDSARKNKLSHPDLEARDYRAIPEAGEAPLLIVQDAERSVVLVSRAGELLWSVVKATLTGEGMFITSVRRTGPADVEALKRREGARILLDKTEGLE